MTLIGEAFVAIKADTKDFEKKTSGLGRAFGGVASGIATAAKVAAGAATAVGVVGVKSFADFDSAMTQSLAIQGNVSESMRGRMSEAAREVGRTTALSATEAAESYFFLASAGLDAEQQIAALPQVAAFAQAGMFDMARATDLATDAQSALGLSSDDADENLAGLTRTTDVFVKANELANTSVEQVAEAITMKAGTAMRQLGIEIEEGTAVLAVFADQGVKGSQAGVQYNAVLEGLTRTARTNADAYKELGVSVFDANGEMRPMADIVEDLEAGMAGMTTEQQNATIANLGLTRQAGDGMRMLLGNSDALREYEEELRNAGGTTQSVADKQMGTLWAQLGLLKDQLLDVAMSVGEALMPHLMRLVEVVQDNVPAIKSFAENAMRVLGRVIGDVVIPAVTLLVGWLSDLWTAAQPLIERIQHLWAVFSEGEGIIDGLRGVWESLGFDRATFDAIVAAVELVIAGVVRLGQIVASTVTWIIENWSKIAPLVKALGVVIVTLLIPHYVALGVAATVAAAKSVAAWVMKSTAALRHGAMILFHIGKMVAGYVAMGVAALKSAAETAYVWLLMKKDALASAWAQVTAIGSIIKAKALLAVKSMVAAVKIAAAWVVAMGPIGWVIAGVVALVALIIANWDTVKEWTAAAWSFVSEKVSDAWSWITEKTSQAVGAVVEWVGNLRDRVVEFFGRMWEFVLEYHPLAIAWRLAVEWVPRIVEAVAGLVGRVVEWFADLRDRAVENLTQMRDNAVERVTAMRDWIVDRATAIRDRVVENLTAMRDNAVERVTAMRDWIVERVTGLRDAIVERATAIRDGVVERFQALRDAVVERVVGLVTTVVTTVAGWVSTVVGFVTDLWQRWVLITHTIRDAVIGAVTWLVDRFVAAVRWLVDTVVGFYVGLYTSVVERVGALRDRVVEFVGAMRDRVVERVSALRDRAVEIITAIRDRFVERFTDLRDRVVGFVGELRDRAVERVTGLRDSAVETVTDLRDRVVGFFGELKDRVIERLVSLATDAVRWFVSTKDEVVRVVTGLVDDVVGFFTELPGKIITALGNLKDRLSSFGRDAMAGLIEGFTGKEGEAVDEALGVAKNMFNVMAGPLGFNLGSPSKLFASMGRNVMQGLIGGVGGESLAAANAMVRVAENAATKFRTTLVDGIRAVLPGLTAALSVVTAAVGTLPTVTQAAMARTVTVTQQGAKALAAAYQTLGRVIGAETRQLGTTNVAAWTKAWQAKQQAARVATRAITGDVAGWSRGVVTAMQQTGRAVTGAYAALWTSVVGETRRSVATLTRDWKALWTTKLQTVSAGIRTVGSTLTVWWRTTVREWVAAFRTLGQATAAGWRTIVTTSVTQLRALRTSWGRETSAWVAATRSGIRQIVTVLRNAQPTMRTLGQRLMEGVTRGIRDRTPQAVSAARSAAQQITRATQTALQVRSPSRVFRTIGQQLMDGLAAGIVTTSRKAVDAVKDTAKRMVDASKVDLEFQSGRPVTGATFGRPAAPAAAGGSARDAAARLRDAPLIGEIHLHTTDVEQGAAAILREMRSAVYLGTPIGAG